MACSMHKGLQNKKQFLTDGGRSPKAKILAFCVATALIYIVRSTLD